MGISWEQAQAYALWRSDRINEVLLIDREHIRADFEGQQGENHFDTRNYLHGYYEAEPGDKPMVDAYTKEERRTNWEDGVLLPHYRLPTADELQHAAQHTKGYDKHKALLAFRKKVLDHNSAHPTPTYYDHQQYPLPYPVIQEELAEAPYHLKGHIGEWTQKGYLTHQECLYHFHPEINVDVKHQYLQPLWVLRLDTLPTNPFDAQHQIDTKTAYQGFRCVLPNLW